MVVNFSKNKPDSFSAIQSIGWLVLQKYHHQDTIDSLCKELHNFGFEKEARNYHLAAASEEADDDVEHRKIILHLVKGVRALRSNARAQEMYTLNTAATLLVLLKDEERMFGFIFNSMTPEAAAKEAVKHLVENVQLDQARGKLSNDFNDSTGVNHAASVKILAVINQKQSVAASWLSLYGARAGGMDMDTYNQTVVSNYRSYVSEQSSLLSKDIRKKLEL